MGRIWKGLAVAGLALLAALSQAVAQDGGAGAGAGTGPVFVVGVVNQDQLPYYGASDGEVTGAARRVLDAFAADRAYRFIYRPLPPRRICAELDSGGIDFNFPTDSDRCTPEKAARPMALSGPLLAARDATFVPAADHQSAPSQIRILGRIAGADMPAWAAGAGAPAAVDAPTVEGLVRIALAGRADAIHANEAVVKAVLRRLGAPGALIRHPDLPGVAYSYHLGSLRHADILAELDAWLSANRSRVRALTDMDAARGPAS